MPKNTTSIGAAKHDHRAALDTAIRSITKTFGSGSMSEEELTAKD